MTLLSLDPSSTRTGYAVMTGPRELIDAGLLTPKRQSDRAIDRARTMAHEVEGLIREHRPTSIVIETPHGKIHGNRPGAASGAAIYGFAAGVIWWVCESYSPSPVYTVDPNTWTNRVSKKHRAACVACDFPRYDKRRDPGMDVADAIALGVWWFAERRVREGAA